MEKLNYFWKTHMFYSIVILELRFKVEVQKIEKGSKVLDERFASTTKSRSS